MSEQKLALRAFLINLEAVILQNTRASFYPKSVHKSLPGLIGAVSPFQFLIVLG